MNIVVSISINMEPLRGKKSASIIGTIYLFICESHA